MARPRGTEHRGEEGRQRPAQPNGAQIGPGQPLPTVALEMEWPPRSTPQPSTAAPRATIDTNGRAPQPTRGAAPAPVEGEHEDVRRRSASRRKHHRDDSRHDEAGGRRGGEGGGPAQPASSSCSRRDHEREIHAAPFIGAARVLSGGSLRRWRGRGGGGGGRWRRGLGFRPSCRPERRRREGTKISDKTITFLVLVHSC